MKLHNTSDSYGAIAKLLHWSMMLLIVFLLGLGIYMTGLDDGDSKWRWYDLHKSFGVVVFVLLVLRIIWRLNNPQPALPSNTKPHEHFLAHAVHFVLYAAMLILPLSGYVDSSAGGYHLGVFGWFEIPLLIPKNETVFDIAVAVHRWVAYGLIALLVLHVAAALKHHLVDKDDVLRKMLP